MSWKAYILVLLSDADLVSGRSNGANGPAPPGRKLLQAGRFRHKPVTDVEKHKCSAKQQDAPFSVAAS